MLRYNALGAGIATICLTEVGVVVSIVYGCLAMACARNRKYTIFEVFCNRNCSFICFMMGFVIMFT